MSAIFYYFQLCIKIFSKAFSLFQSDIWVVRAMVKLEVITFSSYLFEIEVGGGYTGEVPERLETGTPNVSGIISMRAAIEYIEEIGIEKIRERNLELTRYLIEKLEGKVKFEKGPYYANCDDVGYGIISFSIENLPAKDIGFILDSSGIYIRDGKHCREKGKNSVRISLQAYNTEEEIDKLIESIGNISGC